LHVAPSQRSITPPVPNAQRSLGDALAKTSITPGTCTPMSLQDWLSPRSKCARIAVRSQRYPEIPRTGAAEGGQEAWTLNVEGHFDPVPCGVIPAHGLRTRSAHPRVPIFGDPQMVADAPRVRQTLPDGPIPIANAIGVRPKAPGLVGDDRTNASLRAVRPR